MKNRCEAPIGVFDSGVGGLTVVREIMRNLPNEEIVYFGDTARVPYGSKSKETVTRYSRQIVRFLQSKEVKAIVVACNTASAYALETIKKELDIPIIGVVEPGARVACETTVNDRIGVIGTEATVHSGIYTSFIRRQKPDVQVVSKACPLFVPLVEAGYVDHSSADKQQITKLVIAQYLTEMREAGVDTLILGCTHYPLLKTMIGEFMGREVTLVDPAKTAAHHLERLLSERGLRADHPTGQAHFYVSDVPDSFAQTADLFLGEYKGGPIDQIAIDKY